MGKRYLLLIYYIFSSFFLMAQSGHMDSSYQRLLLKYWQYRESFYKHFILVDRNSSGCIGDGIGNSGADPCNFKKSSYSLPATSISLGWSGDLAFGNRNNPNSVLYDPNCLERVHWDQAKSVRFNIINMSSETPSQLGWYIQILAIEYENLRRFGQHEKMKTTLEDLFLALQAIRRLDMQAQCIFQELYNERKQCQDCKICSNLFKVKGEHELLTKSKLKKSCDFQAKMDGYSGFIIREDATQNFGELLHDPSEEKWNIDATSSYHAMINPPCKKHLKERACFLYAHQGFQSQDQVIGLLNGLVFVKKFIPADASVTTCEGRKYYVLEIATEIVKALVGRIDKNPKDYIEFPGSAQCIDSKNFIGFRKKHTNLNNFEGGQASTTVYGMKLVLDYFTSVPSNKTVREKFYYNQLLKKTVTSNKNVGNFWLLLETIGEAQQSEFYQKKCIEFNKEIYLLMNKAIYEEKSTVQIDKKWFEDLLDRAPCSGLCMKYSKYNENTNHKWPTFDCPNTPGWVNGQRWDGGKHQHEVYDEENMFPRSKINNGLDYMSLFNLYSLIYHSEGFPLEDLRSIKMLTMDKFMELGDDALLKKTNKTDQFKNVTWLSSSGAKIYNLDEALHHSDKSIVSDFLIQKFEMVNMVDKFQTVYKKLDSKNPQLFNVKAGKFSDFCLNYELFLIQNTSSKK
jgi:hypothetical protein